MVAQETTVSWWASPVPITCRKTLGSDFSLDRLRVQHSIFCSTYSFGSKSRWEMNTSLHNTRSLWWFHLPLLWDRFYSDLGGKSVTPPRRYDPTRPHCGHTSAYLGKDSEPNEHLGYRCFQYVLTFTSRNPSFRGPPLGKLSCPYFSLPHDCALRSGLIL